MPVIFSGHGSPMIALENNEITKGMEDIGRYVVDHYGKPKAILAISAHWYTDGTYIQSAPQPRQIYDMYGFPEELYAVKYPARGDGELTARVQKILGNQVSVNNDWGIDHGTWTVLVHMFPEADIPVVQLSVNGRISAAESYKIGKQLDALRNEGYLILGSGNIVHNLMRVEWDNEGGTPMTLGFNKKITDAVISGDEDVVIHYDKLPDAAYAVPTPDHFLPLLYCLGAAEGDKVRVFNNVCNLGSMAMTGYLFEKDC
ncbi:MAG: 4,5-DOPA dioxygenase extradiol [Eubacterium sp.]|nr:4,5-DOPA dioxygenase extradiol [Eubacterium sp.]